MSDLKSSPIFPHEISTPFLDKVHRYNPRANKQRSFMCLSIILDTAAEINMEHVG